MTAVGMGHHVAVGCAEPSMEKDSAAAVATAGQYQHHTVYCHP